MQRIIKFRGKYLRTGTFVYGCYVNGIDLTGNEFHQIEIADANNHRIYEVDPATVGQFTGLTDKNGKDIYEGDIVAHGMGGGVIEWIDAYACFKLNEFGELCNPEITCQVIGNIHENPELLCRNSE